MEVAAEATAGWVWSWAAQVRQSSKADAPSRQDERKVITLALFLKEMTEASLDLIAAAFPPTKGGGRAMKKKIKKMKSRSPGWFVQLTCH
jgi:hypothetical protein